jgi:hypothetical protein
LAKASVSKCFLTGIMSLSIYSARGGLRSLGCKDRSIKSYSNY